MPTSAKFDSRFPGICAANSLLGQMQTQDMSYQRHIFKHSKGERLEQAEAEPTGETRGYGGAIATKIPKPVYAIDRPREIRHRPVAPPRPVSQSWVTCLQSTRDPDCQEAWSKALFVSVVQKLPKAHLRATAYGRPGAMLMQPVQPPGNTDSRP